MALSWFVFPDEYELYMGVDHLVANRSTCRGNVGRDGRRRGRTLWHLHVRLRHMILYFTLLGGEPHWTLSWSHCRRMFNVTGAFVRY